MYTRKKGVQRLLAGLVLGAGASCGYAFQLDSGNDDVVIRWDNTVRYNYMGRVGSQDPNILASANSNDGDRNFGKGTVSNRLDLLSEADVVFKRHHGIRVTAASWYDDAYRRLDNSDPATSNHLVNGAQAVGLSNAASRYHRGPSGEILDAFVFTRLDIGSSPLDLKLGRHTVFWGEGLLSPIHSLSYGQSPLDLRKAASVPGVELKELFLPRNALSAQLQASSSLTFSAQYFLDWRPARFPEPGSYLGSADFLGEGGESLITPMGLLLRGSDIKPKKRGDWGLAARWRPDSLDGTLGVYFRNTSDIQPQILLSPLSGSYNLAYPDNIKIFGASLAKNLGSVSMGAEVNWRRNMPLLSEGAAVGPLPGMAPSMPASGSTLGARGDTVHAVLNFMGSVGRGPIYDAANWTFEMQYSRWNKVTQGQNVFMGRDAYTKIDKPTKNYVGFNLNVAPTWYQVRPGVDLSMPISYHRGLAGTSAVAGGGNKGAGNWSIGLSFDVDQTYKIDLTYADNFAPYQLDTANGGIAATAAPYGYIKDRGFLSLTFKTTF